MQSRRHKMSEQASDSFRSDERSWLSDPRSQELHPLVDLLYLLFFVFAAEALVMFALAALPKMSAFPEAIADSLLLTLILAPLLWRVVVQPLRKAGRFRSLVEQSLVGIYIIDGERCLYTNPRAEEIFGYEPGGLAGVSLKALVGDDDWRAAEREIRRLVSGELSVARFEFRGRRKDGRDVIIGAEALRTHIAGRSAIIGVMQDLTERKRAEGTLRLQSAALNAAANAIIITGPNGTIEWINAAFTDLTGFCEEEAIGKNPRDLVKSGVHDQAFYKQVWDTILGGNVWHGEMTNRRKDGSLYPAEQTVTPVKNRRGEVAHFIAVGRDLTQQRRLEAQFLQAQKMETVGRLASGIAHDFNNLLTVIDGTADLALAGLKEGAPLRTDLQDIRQAGERAASLTRQLLAFSRKQIMKPEALDLSTLVADLQGMLQRLIGEHIALVVVPVKAVSNVMADPMQIEQVVMNLAVNARDAMPGGGTLTIETRDVDLDEAYAAEHPSVQPGPHVMLAVSDTGTGMDAATRAQIFEPFFTTKDPGKGTGLGLSTVYGIVKQSGGNIWVYSEAGKGTTFKIYLPRVEGVVRKIRPAPAVTSVQGTETILVVEDEEAVRLLARRVLQRAGYTVLTAGNGAEALLLLARHDGPVDLMLTDIVMPGMSGRELVAQSEDLCPRIKVLCTSGYTDEVILRHGLLDETAHFIGKPYNVAELTRKVREVLDSPA